MGRNPRAGKTVKHITVDDDSLKRIEVVEIQLNEKKNKKNLKTTNNFGGK